MFKTGDRMKLLPDKYYDERSNPSWGGEHGYIMGTVSSIQKTGWVGVNWDNGKSNSYYQSDLGQAYGIGLKVGDYVKLIKYEDYEYPYHKDSTGIIILTISDRSHFDYAINWLDDRGEVSHISKYNCYQVDKPIERIQKDIILPISVDTISRRKFGIELETCYRSANKAQVKRICTDLNTGKEWIDFHHDGSISGHDEYENTTEIVTKPLIGKNGIKKIITLSDELKRQDFKTNKSCGYHVHLSTGTIARDVNKLATLLLFYWVFEDVFFSFLPRSRQENNYCRSLQEIYPNLPYNLESVNTMDKLENLWYQEGSHYYVARKKKDRYDESRYSWVNFHCLFAHTKNLEIRSHNGTIDHTKIVPWIQIHDRIITYVRDGKIDHKSLLKIEEKGSIYLKGLMFDLIQLPDDLRSYFNSRQALFLTGVKDTDDK